MKLLSGNIPRWGIFLIDLSISVFSIFTAYFLRFNFIIPNNELITFPLVFASVILVRGLSFFIFKTYSGIIQYTSIEDAKRIFFTISTGTLFLCFANMVKAYFFVRHLIPYSVIIIDFVVLIFLMTSFRLFVKLMYQEIQKDSREKANVIIYGAGENGMIAKKTLDRDRGTKYSVVAFVDDKDQLLNKKIEGVTIYHIEDLEELLSELKVDLLIISGVDVEVDKKKRIVDICLRHETHVLNVPPASQWINGELSFKQIKEIKIEDLLQRTPIHLDKEKIKNQLCGKKILITGAAGSIGSELVRQIIPFKPKQIILLDNAETPLFDLENELIAVHKISNYEIVVGDVRNKERMENVFNTFRPDDVYHAAAYKHVPLMENNPSESVFTNVMGTKILADMAVKYGVEKFVFVSTDKAVNPTNVMGASKRVAEIYVQSLDRELSQSNTIHTKFVTTRFGNVLGSNGSVIPLFRKQIESGGPVTVTDPNVTRFFMTIPEACQLVLEAGAMGNGGEIFIFDMGESVRIVDLAKKMIKLSGFELGKDIQLVFTGLRPGEKLYEELLNNEENTLPTHHSKIMIAKVREYSFEEIAKEIQALIDLFSLQDNFKIVSKLKLLIPEFVSNNSIYEVLDELK